MGGFCFRLRLGVKKRNSPVVHCAPPAAVRHRATGAESEASCGKRAGFSLSLLVRN